MHYLLAALAGGLLFFNSQATPRKVEQKATSALQKLYPGARVQVQVEAKRGLNVARGRFRRARVSIADLKPGVGGPPFERVNQVKSRGHSDLLEVDLANFYAQGVPVERAQVALKDIDFDWKALQKLQIKILRSGPGTAQVRVPLASLQTLLEARLPSVQEAKVSVEGEQLRVSGQRSILGASVPFVLTAKLTPRGNALFLEAPSLELNGAVVPPEAAASLIAGVNPIYTFGDDQSPFRIILNSAQFRGNALEIGAGLQFVPLPTSKP